MYVRTFILNDYYTLLLIENSQSWAEYYMGFVRHRLAFCCGDRW